MDATNTCTTSCAALVCSVDDPLALPSSDEMTPKEIGAETWTPAREI